ncbi:hypothetical protein GLAREA_09337 [Glarea lozoyensis ATCC 20868]|uniref:Trichothecene 3-O-acetyltransferase n=1 Tax=Glarea lozoyensis (strain ATCC 20868 / MF5171) TaxID=1116229 RepID=S3CP01_GLAL2|nr:uncharacterized protein GLAREA_09337 [Glarea lozoyensis ATCC 20868]EPE28217.1 hypothetical protein GLAREA_09337 [Glarea lozoyensis ATCC 20868]
MAQADIVKSHLVTPEEYGIVPRLSAKLKLSPLDQNMPRMYGSRWILCFPLPAGVDEKHVFENLKKALAYTISAMPWIAGEIGLEEGQNKESNIVQIVEGQGGCEFRCLDRTSDLPSYAELKKNNFSFSKLTTALVSPLQVVQQSQPVFAAQANFIKDGLLLTVGVHHSACDAVALDHILDTWASNTGIEGDLGPFREYDPIVNDRTPLRRGLPDANIAEFPEYFLMPTAKASSGLAPPTYKLPPMVSKVFFVSRPKLEDLKTEARAFSINDALCAFFWHHMTLARASSSLSPFRSIDNKNVPTSAALFAVNIRSRTSPPLPRTYLGNACLGSLTKRLTIASLTHPETGLPQAAAALRAALNATHEPSRVSRTIGLLSSRQNAQDFQFAVKAFLGPDVTMTSWADLKIRDRDWGSLGTPEGFKIPYEGADGNITIYPRLQNGGLEVMVCLESEAMANMVQNQTFLRFAADLDL